MHTEYCALQAASALGAVFSFFVRDVVGMLGGIFFAYVTGSSFDSNAKQVMIGHVLVSCCPCIHNTEVSTMPHVHASFAEEAHVLVRRQQSTRLGQP